MVDDLYYGGVFQPDGDIIGKRFTNQLCQILGSTVQRCCHRIAICLEPSKWATACGIWRWHFTGVCKCPFLGILNITFKYLLDIISPIVGWCSIWTFTNPCLHHLRSAGHRLIQFSLASSCACAELSWTHGAEIQSLEPSPSQNCSSPVNPRGVRLGFLGIQKCSLGLDGHVVHIFQRLFSQTWTQTIFTGSSHLWKW